MSKTHREGRGEGERRKGYRHRENGGWRQIEKKR